MLLSVDAPHAPLPIRLERPSLTNEVLRARYRAPSAAGDSSDYARWGSKRDHDRCDACREAGWAIRTAHHKTHSRLPPSQRDRSQLSPSRGHRVGAALADQQHADERRLADTLARGAFDQPFVEPWGQHGLHRHAAPVALNAACHDWKYTGRNVACPARRISTCYAAVSHAAGTWLTRGVESYDIVHLIAALTIGFVVVRGLQAGVEHYFPSSEPAAVLRFIYGGP